MAEVRPRADAPSRLWNCRTCGGGNSRSGSVHWGQGVPGSKADMSKLDQALKSFDTALPFARQLGFQALVFGDRGRIRIAAATEPGPVPRPVRGLPSAGPQGPQARSNPRPSSILSLTGDSKKGEVLFFNKEMKCATATRLARRGRHWPRLTTIGKTRRARNCSKACSSPRCGRRTSVRGVPRADEG